MSGIDFTNPAVSKSQQASFVVSREPAVPNPAAITYRWSAPDFSPVTHEGRTYTSTAPATPGTYPVTLTAQSEGYCPLAITKVVEVVECTAPGSTVNFTAFVPCSNAATGATWTLLDTRESNNNQNYTVKKMADGRIWMVQDLKFGDKCNRTDFTGSSGKDLTNRVSSLSSSTYYGDCGTSTLANVGYYYDWAAAINKANAYKGNSTDVGCRGTGTAAFACQGLCPSGWHVSTEDEISALCSSFGAITGGCLNIPEFGANITGQFRPSLVDATSYYWHTSTMCDASNTKSYDGGGWGPFYCWGKDTGKPVRCLRNY
jgi:uncharacterized protein (TIGR02145 family)